MASVLLGRKFFDQAGSVWLICARKRPDQPAMAANVDTGELVVFENDMVAAWVELRISAVARLLGSAERTC